MIKKKFIMAIFIVSLLAISAVSANETVDNVSIESDIADSSLQLEDMSDTSIESTTDDDVISMEEDIWFMDKVIWYDGDYGEINYTYLDFVGGLENHDNITIQLSDGEDNGIANVDLAILNDHDNNITKLTTDSKGIAVYNIPFDVEEFSFCVGFWHDENHITNFVNLGQNIIYSFNFDTWFKDNSNVEFFRENSEFFIGRKISLGPLNIYLPEVPDPSLPSSGSIHIDFTKPIVDENYPRVIDLTNPNIPELASNDYGNVELNGRDLILKSLDRDNYTIYAGVSGKYSTPYLYESNGLGEFDAHIYLDDVSLGNHDVKIYFYGDPKFDFIYRINYYPVVVMTLPIYIKSTYAISAANLTTYSGSGYGVVLTNDSNPVANEDVRIVVNGESRIVKTDNNGRAIIYLPEGEYDLTSYYDDVSTNSHVTVKSTISTTNAVGEYLNTKINATFLNTEGNTLASRQVSFKVGDKIYSATTDANGVATANVDLGAGTYRVTAVNPVNGEEKQFSLRISKSDSQISLSSVQNNGIVTLTAVLTPAFASGNVAFNINGENKNSQIKNGKATLTLLNLEAGDYVVTATYDGDNNLKVSTSNAANFKVDEVYPILTANPVTKTYGSSTKLVVNLMDNKGNAIANADVNVVIDDVSEPIKTNANGQATLNIKKAPGKYDATITYANAQTTAKITVKKATPKITAAKKTFKASVKTKKYTVTLKVNGKAFKSKKVTLSVKGKKYSATTNSKGKATFKITKFTKKGTFTATIKYSSNKYYNTKTAKVKITVK